MSDDKQQQAPQEHDSEEQQSMQEEQAEQASTQAPEDDYKLKWMRAQADYQNLLKEVATQKSEWAKMSEVQILQEFIPVYENFKKAFAHGVEQQDRQWENWKKGIEYIMKQFGDILRNHGVEEIITIGQAFNPELHEAVSEEDSEEYDAGIIIRELSGGYKVGDKVIQVAKVILAK